MKKPPDPAHLPCKITPCLSPRSSLSVIDVSPSVLSFPLYSVATVLHYPAIRHLQISLNWKLLRSCPFTMGKTGCLSADLLPISKTSVIAAVIGSTAPERMPTPPQRRSRSRTGRFPAVSTINPISVVSDLVLQIQGFLPQDVTAAHLNRFELVFTLNAFRESCFFTEHSVTEWNLLAVSLYFHFAVFRSEVQVSFFTFLFSDFCCNCLLYNLSALVPFFRTLRMNSLPSIVLTGFLWIIWGWSLGCLDCPFQDSSPLLLMFGIYYASLIGLVTLADCLPLGMPFTCFSDIFVSYGTYFDCYFVVNFGDGSWFLYVLGVCVLVLGLHPMMLAQALQGLCSRYGKMPLCFSTLLTILHLFVILAISGLALVLTRISYCYTLVLLVGLEFTSWEGQHHLVLRLSSSGSILRFNGLIDAPPSLLCVWRWWQDVWSYSPYSQPRCMRHCLLFVANPHALMCSLPVGMVGKSPYGGWFFTYMMRIPSSSCAAWLAFSVYWGLPSFWLSQLLERLNALKHRVHIVAGNDQRVWSLQVLVFALTGWKLHLCSRPFAFLPCMQAMMCNTSINRLLRSLLLLCCTYEQIPFWNVVLAIWTSLSFLLSSLFVTLNAQLHDDTHFCFCWHWITSHFRWDEVKGVSLVVYDDIFSETNLCNSQSINPAILRQICYHREFYLTPCVGTDNHRMGVPYFLAMLFMNDIIVLADHRLFTSCCICPGMWLRHLLSHDWMHDCYGALTPIWDYLALYWKYLIGMPVWMYLYFIVAPNLCPFVHYSLNYCNYWGTKLDFKAVFVFGLCHKALAQHRWMLRPALRGFDIISSFLRLLAPLHVQITMHRCPHRMLLLNGTQYFNLKKPSAGFSNRN